MCSRKNNELGIAAPPGIAVLNGLPIINVPRRRDLAYHRASLASCSSCKKQKGWIRLVVLRVWFMDSLIHRETLRGLQKQDINLLFSFTVLVFAPIVQKQFWVRLLESKR